MTTPTHSAGPVVNTLLNTLEQEAIALERLADAVAGQLDALRERQYVRLQEGADVASETVAEMAKLRQARERQTRLLGRVLGICSDEGEHQGLEPLIDALAARDAEQAARLRTARGSLRELARTTDAQCKELEFALGVAVRLGRDLLHAWQRVDTPVPSSVYTAAGRTSPPAPRPFVNHVG